MNTPAPEPISRHAPRLIDRVVASQRWSQVAFLHWRVPSDELTRFMPRGVRPDEHDGSSWVGLIAFFLSDARLGTGPAIPYFGTFAEVNVRLYGVDERGRRGVIFLSLEASRLPAVCAARALFSIPYFWSRTTLVRHRDAWEYRSVRHWGQGRSRIVVRPGSEPVEGNPLADFLTARWGLFTTRRGTTIFLPNEHEPWPLVRADLVAVEDSLLDAAGLGPLAVRTPDSVLFANEVNARFGPPLA